MTIYAIRRTEREINDENNRLILKMHQGYKSKGTSGIGGLLITVTLTMTSFLAYTHTQQNEPQRMLSHKEAVSRSVAASKTTQKTRTQFHKNSEHLKKAR